MLDLYDCTVSLDRFDTLAWAGFLVKMSHRTAATALLLASLPYGLALPQVVPLLNGVAPVVPALTLSLASSAPTVTVIGTPVPAVVSAAEDATDAVDDATDIVASTPLDTVADATAEGFPAETSGLDIDFSPPFWDDPDATTDDLPDTNELEVIDLPPPVWDDAVPSILPAPVPSILPAPVVANETSPSTDNETVTDDLPDTNDLGVVDLPAPSEVPYGDDGLIADPPKPWIMPLPDFEDAPNVPDVPPEQTVPISTFNAVVQPLLTVIQTLINSLPGNAAPASPEIFIHPLLPTETPTIFIDPLLPTETLPVDASTATDAVDPFPLDGKLEKRQEIPGLSTTNVLALVGPILDLINKFIAQIPVVGPALDAAVPDLEDIIPTISILPVPALPATLPALVLTNISLPVATLLTELPVDVSELPLPTLTADASELPVSVTELPVIVPTNVFDIPVPDDIPGLDDLDIPDVPATSDLPVPSLDDWTIPDDILNVPVPDLDEDGVPIEAPVDATADAVSDLPTLPTSLPTLHDWPFGDFEAPSFPTPDADGFLPDLDDIPIPDDVLNVPVPDLDDQGNPIDLPTTEDAGGIVSPDSDVALPSELPAILLPGIPPQLLPTDNLPVPIPTNILDVPVPDLSDLVAAIPTDVLNVPIPDLSDLVPSLSDAVTSDNTAPSLPTLPIELPDFQIPDDVLNIPVPDLDENGVPIDLPTDADSAPAPALPEAAFGAGFPIQALPDIPLVLPAASEVESALPTEALTGVVADLPTALPADVVPTLVGDVLTENLALPTELPTELPEELPTELPTGLTDELPTELPTELPAELPTVLPDELPTVLPNELPTVLPDELPTELPTVALPIADVPAVSEVPSVSILPAVVTSVVSAVPVAPVIAPIPPVVAPVPPVVAPVPVAVPATLPSLPFQVPGVARPLGKRETTAAQAPTAIDPTTAITLSLIKPLLSLVGALLAKVPGIGANVPDFGALLPDVSSLLPALAATPGAVVPDITSLLNGLPAAGLIPNLGAVVPNVAGVATPVTGAVAAVPGISGVLTAATSSVPKVPVLLGSGLGKRRLAVEPAEVNSFLGELDESARPELKALIQDVADALNTNDVENLAPKLRTDLNNMNDETKAKIVTGHVPGPVLKTLEERSMRHGKRQIPGVLSIGPNLDDASKVDLSSILGPAGTLDPNNQITPYLGAGSILDPDYSPPSFDALPDSSINTALGPQLAHILGAAGTLDPNNQLDPSLSPGSPVDDVVVVDPYADLRNGWKSALDPESVDAIEGLEATIQAAKANHVGAKPKLPFSIGVPQGGSAAAQQAQAAALLSWFQRNVRPSGRSDVDPVILA
ncbi:hypothetical protein N0V94_002332 [Neodidymelliopsis sp. IMI 364377]|nr:hypothetical protein N0V94_002332 [Neodidymelliopsis sp. IMI 364377]